MFNSKKIDVGLVCCLALFPFSSLAADEKGGKDQAVVAISIDRGDGKSATQYEIDVSKDETVFSLMQRVAKREKAFSFQHKGQKSTVLVTSIIGLKNQGGRGKNWIFRVNGKLGDKSIGVYQLKKGDQVLWKFGKYK